MFVGPGRSTCRRISSSSVSSLFPSRQPHHTVVLQGFLMYLPYHTSLYHQPALPLLCSSIPQLWLSCCVHGASLLLPLRLKHKMEARLEARTGIHGLNTEKLSKQPDKDQVRKAQALTELNLALNVKGNKESFCRYFSDKRKTKEKLWPLQKETRDLVT